MDRQIVYPGSVPLETDLLNAQVDAMVALGYLAQIAIGTAPFVEGLAVAPTAPASLSVTVGPGCLGVLSTVDATAYSTLTASSDPLVKIGINRTATTLTFVAPTISGTSQNFLIQAAFAEADATPVALPYFNSAAPSVAWSGPNNSGTVQNTVRTQRVSITLKVGPAAVTGTQSTPVPDSGWVGIAVVTLNNGDSSITSAKIAPYSAAPFIPTKLPQLRVKLTSTLNIYVSTSGNDSVNSGLSASSPFLTLQKAWNFIINTLDLNGQNVIVNLANGTYNGGLVAQGVVTGLGSGNSVTFYGNNATPDNVVVSTSGAHAIFAALGASICVAGFLVRATGVVNGVQANGLYATNSGTIAVSGTMDFGGCAGQQMSAAVFGSININANYFIRETAQCHMFASASGFINVGSQTVTLTGTPNFTVAFAQATLGGFIQLLGMTYSGAATGTKYSAVSNGIINTNNAGANYLPGSTAGGYTSQGLYL